ncbi:MAG: FHA domain-containing protein [Polyangiaceae bacterium]|nr:FHA domain-containing protein [Polyangiaceae bacterium]MCW5788829.1 FHA domain-containing protein [Polyangiaceae bacterium]
MTDPPTHWLLGLGRAIRLGAYPTVVGREETCDLVIVDDPLVSRRHASFFISQGQPRVEDLMSRNGVFVEGQRVERARALSPGEQVQLGSVTLRVEERLLSELETPAPSTRLSSTTADTLGPDSEHGTVFALLGGVAQKALKLGNLTEAERVLAPALELVLSEAERLGRLDGPTHQQSLSFACQLAAATRRPEWLSYPIKLQLALERPPPAEIVDQLYQLIVKIERPELAPLRDLVRCLNGRREALSASERFLASRVEGLLRLAER